MTGGQWSNPRAFHLLVFSALLALVPVTHAGPSGNEFSRLAALAPHSLLLDTTQAGDRFVAVGERGHVLTAPADDIGHWMQVTVPTRVMLTAVYFTDSQTGWTVGHDAVILRTRDGGNSWQTVHYAPEEERPLLDVWFQDRDNGFAIGAYGYFLRSSDGGDSWQSVYISDDDFHLNSVQRASNGKLYIAAEAGMAYRSDDDGFTWRTLESPYEGSFFGTLPLEGDSVLLFGLRGHLYRSDDAGETWRSIETGTEAMLTDARRLPDGRILVSGLAGTLLISHDGGDHFDLVQQANRLGISALIALDEQRIIAVGEGGIQTLAVPSSPVSGP